MTRKLHDVEIVLLGCTGRGIVKLDGRELAVTNVQTGIAVNSITEVTFTVHAERLTVVQCDADDVE